MENLKFEELEVAEELGGGKDFVEGFVVGLTIAATLASLVAT